MGKYDDRPYEVGKGKPPRHGSFGNRPQPTRRRSRKGSKNADTIVREALDAQVTVVEGGKERKIAKFALAVAQIVNQAAKGDVRAFKVMMDLKRDIDSRGDPAADQPLVIRIIGGLPDQDGEGPPPPRRHWSDPDTSRN